MNISNLLKYIYLFFLFVVPTKRRKGRPSTLQEEEEASSLDTQSGSRSDMRIPSSIYNTRITTDAPAEVNCFSLLTFYVNIYIYFKYSIIVIS